MRKSQEILAQHEFSTVLGIGVGIAPDSRRSALRDFQPVILSVVTHQFPALAAVPVAQAISFDSKVKFFSHETQGRPLFRHVGLLTLRIRSQHSPPKVCRLGMTKADLLELKRVLLFFCSLEMK